MSSKIILKAEDLDGYLTEQDNKYLAEMDNLYAKAMDSFKIISAGATGESLATEEKKVIDAFNEMGHLMQKICDDIFSTMTDEELQRLVYDIFPNVFVQAMYDKVAHVLYSSESQTSYDMKNICRSIVDQAFRSRGGY